MTNAWFDRSGGTQMQPRPSYGFGTTQRRAT
jgi:hypothetical protein